MVQWQCFAFFCLFLYRIEKVFGYGTCPTGIRELKNSDCDHSRLSACKNVGCENYFIYKDGQNTACFDEQCTAYSIANKGNCYKCCPDAGTYSINAGGSYPYKFYKARESDGTYSDYQNKYIVCAVSLVPYHRALCINVIFQNLIFRFFFSDWYYFVF
jgi:hypothetical protein